MVYAEKNCLRSGFMKKALVYLLLSVVILFASIPLCAFEMYKSHKAYDTLHVEELQSENARIKAKIDLIYGRVVSHDQRLSDVKNTVSRAENIMIRAKKVRAEITAYTCSPAECGKPVGSPGYAHTRSGYVLTQADAWKVIAVDPSFIPMGSRCYIPGVGIVTARDTGGAIKHNVIDLFVDMGNTSIAKQWGRRTMDIYILED